ncbi:DUF4190 domain-containing protein [Streptomyces sp. CRN 30]|uniref:DUF4190 domain-containing protein n=1 Tax=Streptomyces sp. CRN 30 TaxID=3075613 RepID=UPI002A824418|nr:DUF4190 domain-containing protein [Streptomyces sp. CRN 30]
MAWAHDQHGSHQATPGPAAGQRNGFGIAALVLGLLAAVLFWTVIGGIALGVLAVVFGILGHRRKKRGIASNGAMALIGAVLGALALIASSLILAAGVSLLNSDEFKSYSDCVEHANTQAEREQCAEDFERDANN